MHTVDVVEAQQHFSSLIDQTLRGDEVIITKAGQPVAKLVAISKTRKLRICGTAKGLIKIDDDFYQPLEDFDEYR